MAEARQQYSWKWIWSDHGDEIISSSQVFPSKELCQLDALKHQPTIRTGEKKGRTGGPKMVLRASAVLEYRWMMYIYNDKHERIGSFSEDRWYDTSVECLQASYKLTPELFDSSFYCDVDFDVREKV